MHMMNTIHTSGSQDGCTLPGFKDFLREIEPKKTGPIGPRPTTEPSSIFKKRPGSCPSQGDLYNGFIERLTQLPTPDHVIFVPEADLVPEYMGNSQLERPETIRFARRSRQQHYPLPETAIEVPINPFRTTSPFRPDRCIQPLIVAPGGRGPLVKLESSYYRSSAGKIASNDKHKQSEKHRRDEMSAYIQAADILRGFLPSGTPFNCDFCIQDMSLNEDLCSSTTMPDNFTAIELGPASKKTKNESLKEGLMFQFSAILHGKRKYVGLCLDEIRAVASQAWREQQLGKDNDFAKGGRWDAGSRAEVYVEMLRKMRYACESHGVPPCACGKHEVEDWPTDAFGALVTPPSSSSRTSPMVGQKRSRETTEEEEEVEEDRRVKWRRMARL